MNDPELTLRAMLERAQFLGYKPQYPIDLGRPLGPTVPDFFFDSRNLDIYAGLCVYLDGMAGHLHGRPETQKRDREIREELRNQGYDVIEIQFGQLSDPEAMRQHFGQGQPISPLLANIYLHHALDVWFEEVVKPRLIGEAYEIRFADDAILCFQHKEDAEKVLRVLPKRFEKFGLTLHPEKTRLIEFGRHAARNARKQGKKPETFDFLGFKHLCARSRKGKFTVHVKTLAKRLRRGLKAIADWSKQYRHKPVDEQQKTLNAKLRGHYQYYGRPTNYHSIRQFYRRVCRIWREWLSRRTRGQPLTWDRYSVILRQHPLLLPRITHAWVGAGSYA